MNKRVSDAEEQDINLLDLIAVIVKRKNFIFGLALAAAIISFAITVLKPTQYSATVRVMPPEKKNAGLISALSMVMDKSEIPTALLGENLSENAQVCAGILQSKSVKDNVIRRFELTQSIKNGEGRRTLEGMVKVEVGKNDIISITVQDKDPIRATAIAGAFVEELATKRIHLNLIQVSAESAFLHNMLDEIRQDLHQSQVFLKSCRSGKGDLMIKPQTLAALQNVVGLNQLLMLRKQPPADVYGAGYGFSREAMQKEIAKLQGKLVVYERVYRSNFETADQNMSNYTKVIKELNTRLELFELLTRQYRLVRLSEASEPSSARALDGSVSTQKMEKKLTLIVALSTVTAFFIAIFLAFILECGKKMQKEHMVRWEEIKRLAWFRLG